MWCNAIGMALSRLLRLSHHCNPALFRVRRTSSGGLITCRTDEFLSRPLGAVLVRTDSTAHLCATPHGLRVSGMWNAARAPRSVRLLVPRWSGSSGCRRRSKALSDRAWARTCGRPDAVRRHVGVIPCDEHWFSDADCGAGGALYCVDTRRMELPAPFRRRCGDARVPLLSRMGGLRVRLVDRRVVSCASYRRRCAVDSVGDELDCTP